MLDVKPIIEVAQEAVAPKIEVIDGRKYSTRLIHLIKAPEPGVLGVKTLAGVVEYVKRNPDKLGDITVQVEDYRTVYVHGIPPGALTRSAILVAAEKIALPEDMKCADRETAIVFAMKSFLPCEDLDRLLKILGGITTENVIEESDNGATQHAAVRQGVKTAYQEIQNPFHLQVPATFADIDQPVLPAFLRLAGGDKGARVSLYFAGRNDWKQTLVEKITASLRAQVEVPVIG